MTSKFITARAPCSGSEIGTRSDSFPCPTWVAPWMHESSDTEVQRFIKQIPKQPPLMRKKMYALRRQLPEKTDSKNIKLVCHVNSAFLGLGNQTMEKPRHPRRRGLHIREKKGVAAKNGVETTSRAMKKRWRTGKMTSNSHFEQGSGKTLRELEEIIIPERTAQ